MTPTTQDFILKLLTIVSAMLTAYLTYLTAKIRNDQKINTTKIEETHATVQEVKENSNGMVEKLQTAAYEKGKLEATIAPVTPPTIPQTRRKTDETNVDSGQGKDL